MAEVVRQGEFHSQYIIFAFIFLFCIKMCICYSGGMWKRAHTPRRGMDLLCKAKASQASFLHVSVGQGTHQASRGCDHPVLLCRLGHGGWDVFLICLKSAQGLPQGPWSSYFEIFSFFLCLGFVINQIIWLLSQSFNIKQFIFSVRLFMINGKLLIRAASSAAFI